MSQQTVSKCLHEVIDALNTPEIIKKYVKFPITRAQRANLKIGFNNKFGLPGLCGAIDCTQVALHRPILFEERFFNRKHFHSLNVQVAYSTYQPTTPHIPSGYPLREYLLTPVPGAVEGTPEGRFNATRKRARCTIERAFGILKGRWRCLLAARELYYDPETVRRMVIACSVLHYVCVAAQLEPLELDAAELALENELQRAAPSPSPSRAAQPPPPPGAAEALRRGREARENLIRRFFA